MITRLLLTCVLLINASVLLAAQQNDSIPRIKSLKIDSVVVMKVPIEQDQVANWMNGSVYATLVASKIKCSKFQSKRLLKSLSDPRSFSSSDQPCANGTHAICFYTSHYTCVLVLYNNSTGLIKIACYAPIEGFKQEITPSNPYLYEFKLNAKARKKLKKVL
jgi:hypothetical protein